MGYVKNGVLFMSIFIVSGCTFQIPIGQHEETHVLTIAEEKARNNPHALFLLGKEYLDHNKFDEARDAFERAIEAKPDFVEAYAGLGHACRGLKLYGPAEQAYKKGIALEPGNSLVRIGLSRLYLEQGKFDLVRLTLQPLIDRQDVSYEVDSLIAYSYYLEGDYKTALREFEKILDAYPLEKDPAIRKIYNDLQRYMDKYSPSP